MHQIDVTPAMMAKIRTNFQNGVTQRDTAGQLGVCPSTVAKIERRLGIIRTPAWRQPSARQCSWEGHFFMVASFCRTYVIIQKRSENPRWEIARKMAVSEIVYSAKGRETVTDLIRIAKRWEQEAERKESNEN